MAFLDYLVQKGILKARELDQIIEESADSGDIEPVLVKHGIDEKKILDLKAAYYNVPFKSVDTQSLSADVIRIIDNIYRLKS